MKTFKNCHLYVSWLSVLFATSCTHDLSKVPEFEATKAVSQQQPRLWGAQSTTLPNGLKVIVIEDHFVPKVQLYVMYGVGAADDPATC